MSNNMRVIEINGVKLEVDMRHARRVDELRVGSKVKVLVKEYSDFKVYPGVIVGFEEFQKLPTIIVAYLVTSWSSADIKFLHYNGSTTEHEVVAASSDETELNRGEAVEYFDREIKKKKNELADLEEKKAYFERTFGVYWRVNLEKPEETTTNEE